MVTKEKLASLRAKGILGPSIPEDDPIYQQGWKIIMRPGIEQFIQRVLERVNREKQATGTPEKPDSPAQSE